MGDALTAPATPGAPVAPSDGDQLRRAAEADRAKKRRLLEKLKQAKTSTEALELMKKLGGGADPDAPATAVDQVKPEKLEPGQKPGWPKPSEVAVIEPFLADAFQETGSALTVGAALIEDQDMALLVRAMGTVLSGEGGAKLASKWAPLVALYAPAFLGTPHFAAIAGTVAFAVAVKSAAVAELQAKAGEVAPA